MLSFHKNIPAQCACKFAAAILLAWLAAIAMTATAFAQNVEDAIVKVESTINGQEFEGLGFAWQPASASQVYIVTPLHLVAGSSKIAILSPGDTKLADAKIHKYVRKADLALLAPAGALNIPALPVYSGARLPTTANLWGISKQRVGSFDMRLGGEKRLFDLFRREPSQNQAQKLPPLTPQDVSKHFDPHFYPDVQVSILALAKPVGEGDSGSPITYGNEVISMVDGGLQNLGGIKKAWWSIPLKSNLDLLWAQGETDASKVRPYTGKSGRILFCKPRGQNQPVHFKNVDAEIREGESNLELYLTDQLAFSDVYDSMLPEDRAFIAEVIDDDAAFKLEELFDEEIEVYEDYNTGATFAIPTMLADDLVLAKDGGFTYVEAFSRFSEDSRSFVKLIIMIATEGRQAKDDFKEYLLSGDALEGEEWADQNWQEVEWVQDKESDDDVVDNLDDPDDPYYFEIMERVYERFDEDGNLIDDGEIYSSMTINAEGVFLGAAIIVNDPASLKGDDLVNYYLMEACMTMAGFPY